MSDTDDGGADKALRFSGARAGPPIESTASLNVESELPETENTNESPTTEEHAAAKTIQTSWRKRSTHSTTDAVSPAPVVQQYGQAEADAALRIQTTYRGHASRTLRRREHAAAKTIQRSWRAAPVRATPAPVREASSEEHSAAATIQSQWRGRAVRKTATEQEKAAATIQGQWRGHHARREAKRQHTAATSIQSQWRGRMARKDSMRRTQAAAAIQKSWRGRGAAGEKTEKKEKVRKKKGKKSRKHKEKKKEEAPEEVAAARTIQKAFRRHSYYKRRHVAATTIQTSFRQHRPAPAPAVLSGDPLPPVLPSYIPPPKARRTPEGRLSPATVTHRIARTVPTRLPEVRHTSSRFRARGTPVIRDPHAVNDAHAPQPSPSRQALPPRSNTATDRHKALMRDHKLTRERQERRKARLDAKLKAEEERIVAECAARDAARTRRIEEEKRARLELMRAKRAQAKQERDALLALAKKGVRRPHTPLYRRMERTYVERVVAPAAAHEADLLRQRRAGHAPLDLEELERRAVEVDGELERRRARGEAGIAAEIAARKNDVKMPHRGRIGSRAVKLQSLERHKEQARHRRGLEMRRKRHEFGEKAKALVTGQKLPDIPSTATQPQKVAKRDTPLKSPAVASVASVPAKGIMDVVEAADRKAALDQLRDEASAGGLTLGEDGATYNPSDDDESVVEIGVVDQPAGGSGLTIKGTGELCYSPEDDAESVTHLGSPRRAPGLMGVLEAAKAAKADHDTTDSESDESVVEIGVIQQPNAGSGLTVKDTGELCYDPEDDDESVVELGVVDQPESTLGLTVKPTGELLYNPDDDDESVIAIESDTQPAPTPAPAVGVTALVGVVDAAQEDLLWAPGRAGGGLTLGEDGATYNPSDDDESVVEIGVVDQPAGGSGLTIKGTGELCYDPEDDDESVVELIGDAEAEDEASEEADDQEEEDDQEDAVEDFEEDFSGSEYDTEYDTEQSDD